MSDRSLLLHSAILSALGGYLVDAGPPQKADIALVLAGDSSGNRILKAAELVRDGIRSKVLVSGPRGHLRLLTKAIWPFRSR